ncbi:MAG: hypothetical protein LC723_06040 [Actinobacteria bacterium]|nr:hypothetical protein [Actinomycetota bacterium]
MGVRVGVGRGVGVQLGVGFGVHEYVGVVTGEADFVATGEGDFPTTRAGADGAGVFFGAGARVLGDNVTSGQVGRGCGSGTFE